MAGERANIGSVPVPDPSVLTTAQVQREVSHVKELYEARFTETAKAITLLQTFADKSPTTAVLEQEVIALSGLVEERFKGVEKQFVERDVRQNALSLADKTAIAAALQAQKEAAGAQAESNAAATAKQELAFTKLLEQIQQTQSATNKSTDDKINALTGRLDRGEGRSWLSSTDMPVRLNEIWRVCWVRPNNGVIQMVLMPGRVSDDPLHGPEYLMVNLLRDHGEPKLGEVYRVSIQPAFPTAAGTDDGHTALPREPSR